MNNHSILPQIVHMQPQTTKNQIKIKLSKDENSKERSNEAVIKAEFLRENEATWSKKKGRFNEDTKLAKTHGSHMAFIQWNKTHQSPSKEDRTADPGTEATKNMSMNQTAKNSFLLKRNTIELDSCILNNDLNLSIESSKTKKRLVEKTSTLLLQDPFKGKLINLDLVEDAAKKMNVKLCPLVQTSEDTAKKLRRINSPSAKGSSLQFDFGVQTHFGVRRFTNLND